MHLTKLMTEYGNTLTWTSLFKDGKNKKTTLNLTYTNFSKHSDTQQSVTQRIVTKK
jgi:hypothetical protein